jgi:hypothetical protein
MRTRRMSETLAVHDHDMEVVKVFKCLSTVINTTNDETLEIKTTLLAAPIPLCRPYLCQNKSSKIIK